MIGAFHIFILPNPDLALILAAMKKAVLLLLSVLPLSLGAQSPAPAKPEPPKAMIDLAEVDADFRFQGEYSGLVGDKSVGVQIVAQGDGKFEAVAYIGGLPGDGWDGDHEGIKRASGALNEAKDTAHFSGENGITAKLDGTNLSIFAGDGSLVATLPRKDRVSPTMAAKAPEGAIVLFSGKDNNHFPGSKVDADGLLEQGANSSDTFGDCTLHVEFMLSYMPKARGQGRSNSGVYLQSRYETQVLDSFGLAGKNNECGGIYTIAAPKVNMCFPPLTWQTYDIDFTAAKYDESGKKTANARMTVKHNGIVIHENVELPHTTTSAPLKEENTPGPLHLQNHGNPVRYRNIWVLPRK